MKTEFTLHKLPEGFIITSNEEIKESDRVLHLGREQLFSVHHFSKSNGSKSFIPKDEFELPMNIEMLICDCKKVIAQQDEIDFSALSEEEQKEIEYLDVNLTKLCYYDKRNPDFQIKEEFGYDKEEIESTGNFSKKDCACDNCFYGRSNLTEQLLKARELTSDRRFTLEDMENAFYNGWNYRGEQYNFPSAKKEYLQYLLQPKSWKIQLQMEPIISLDGHTVIGIEPKLTNGKIKILKLL